MRPHPPEFRRRAVELAREKHKPSFRSGRIRLATGSGILSASPTELERDVANMAFDGAEWVRFDFDWSHNKPVRGSFDWSQPDRVVAAAERHGIKVLGLLTYSPAWSRPSGTSSHSPPSDLATFAAFARAASNRHPHITAWEVRNGPNHTPFWTSPSATRYVALLRATYAVLDPADTVLTGGLSPYGGPWDRSSSGTLNPVTFIKTRTPGPGRGSSGNSADI